MWYSGTVRRRHPHLENFLMRKLTNEKWSSCSQFSTAVTNYQPCVVSGLDPAHDLGPLPYFGYLVPTKEQLLVVHWPAKNVQTLVHLKNVINIVAVAGVSPVFLFSPCKEKAQQIRICYHDDHLEAVLEDTPKAIDVYLLDPPNGFIKNLRRIWIQRLINFTLAPKDSILNTNTFAGSRYYEWLLQSIRRSSNAKPNIVLANISRISVWTKQDAGFQKSLWEDMTIFDWIFERLQALLNSSNENDQIIAAIIECLVVILENTDSPIAWTILEPRMDTLTQAVLRLSIKGGIHHLSSCIAILNGILWLPLSATHSKSPIQGMIQSLTVSSNWESCLKQLLDCSFSTFKHDRCQFRSEEIVFLFKCFLLFHRLTEDRNGTDILRFIRFHYCEEFRYYVIVDQLSTKFPEFCKLKNLVIQLGYKLKRAVLCESKYSCI